jgi:hypothetical protein
MSKISQVKVGAFIEKNGTRYKVTKIVGRDDDVVRKVASKSTDFVYLDKHPMVVASSIAYPPKKTKSPWSFAG